MAFLKLNKPFSYTKINFEDPDEIQHRRAQFLIYKVLQKVDNRSSARQRSWLRVKVCRLKMKIGKRLRRLRKRFSSIFFLTKADFRKKMAFVLKSYKHLVHGKQASVAGRVPSMF
ncbi:Unknown protein [Striga hermonthica]|uniref:Uncharacterized protein n=1 Tax=Striga hermonthica TaxID=68872 RepID=A0A9N7RF45_STRHE|nr:Unknown protein [Striga hermonthica]